MTSCYECDTKATVTGATWVVVDSSNYEGDHCSSATILYTLEDVYSLDLSKLNEI